MHQVLLVENDFKIEPLVFLSTQNLADLKWVKTLKEAQILLLKNHFDVVLLDMDFPDGNGIDFCSILQSSYPHLIIFFLTSEDSLSNKVLAFSAGADDYMTKPFAPLELRARLESRFKKQVKQHSDADIEKWKELQICKSRQEVLTVEQDVLRRVELTSIEFKILMYLSQHLGEVIVRDKILNEIWGEDVHVYHRSVDTHISKLRKKLGRASHVVQSIHGVGYKFQPTAI